MSKQDRQGVRQPADVERKWNIQKKFNKAMEAAGEASKEVESLDANMNQTEIFNRLTNYGKAQGLFMDEEGNVFINASFLTTGILQSLDGKTFYLDLVKGVLRGQFEEFSISGKSVEEIASDAEKYADKAAKKAVNAQTQRDVFNKLTNNGKSHGIFYMNGQLYINASYLAAGILKSQDGTTFNLDIANNELKILGKKVSWEQQDDGTFHLVGK